MAHGWLNNKANQFSGCDFNEACHHKAVSQVVNYLSIMQIDGKVFCTLNSADINISKLSSLLSDAWLCDEVMDLMLSSVAEKAITNHEASQSVYVGDSALSRWFAQVTAREPHRKMVVQRALEQCIQEGVLKRLYMVHNIENTHWVAVEVDVAVSQIRIGDSLEWNRSCSDLVTGLNAWLSTTLHQPFKVSYNLPHGKQQDTYSCGICSINAIEHCIIPSIPLWTPAL